MTLCNPENEIIPIGDRTYTIEWSKFETDQDLLNRSEDDIKDSLYKVFKTAYDNWNRHGLGQFGAAQLIGHFQRETIQLGDNTNPTTYNKSILIASYWNSMSGKKIIIE